MDDVKDYNVKALGLVVSKIIFFNCIYETYFLTLWPTYANDLNHF